VRNEERADSILPGPAVAATKISFDHLYHHERVLEVSRGAEQVLGDLYRHYRDRPHALPPHVVARFGEEGEARAIADYIAGMTDRFALAEHEKLRA
jgi:dGTPase